MQRFRTGKKGMQAVILLLIFSLLITGFSTNSMVSKAAAKGKKTVVIKTVSLKIGKKKVTKKTYKMKLGEKKKLKVSVSPKKGKKTIQFNSSNKKVVTVNKSGLLTAKKTGSAKIKVTVKARKKGTKVSTKKTTWVKIKVVKAKNTNQKDDQNTSEEEPNSVTGRKSLVVYFSCTDTTKKIAEYVQQSIGADIYRIQPTEPYTAADLNYGNAESRASREQNDIAARPTIAGNLPDLSAYEIVYLGYPVWFGQAPKIMYSFVENCNLSGKIIIPFCTSHSSGIGTSATNLQTAASGNATWIGGQRFSGSSSKADVEKWIKGLNIPAAPNPTDTGVTTAPDESTQKPSETEKPIETESPTESPTVAPTVEPTEPPVYTPTPEPDVSEPVHTPKSLVVYFSCTDTTKKIAEYVQESTGSDIYRMEAEVPYTAEDLNYGDSSTRATREQNDSSARPAISGTVSNMQEYDFIFLSYPIWWGQAPRIISTFLESYDFSGKTIIPICTSHSSGIGSSATNLHSLVDGSVTWLDGRRFSATTSKEEVIKWLEDSGIKSLLEQKKEEQVVGVI